MCTQQVILYYTETNLWLICYFDRIFIIEACKMLNIIGMHFSNVCVCLYIQSESNNIINKKLSM